MHIRSFHIESFGMLSGVTVDDLPAGMGIFLGQNEAGKSTCLEFFRTMLTGYPPANSKEGKRLRELAGQGGFVHLELEDGSLLRLGRRPGPGAGVPSLFDATGKPLDMAVLDSLLGGVDREVYRYIYGFSLSELQSFETLSTDAVRNALYGSSFGLGHLNSPAAVLDRLNTAMNDTFKPSGKKPPLNEALRQWEEVRRDLRLAEEEAARYDALAEDMERTGLDLAGLRQEKKALEGERRQLERRLGVWNMWEEWRLSHARLERLEPVGDDFPLDGPARLDRLLDKRDLAQRQCALLRERLEAMAQGLPDLSHDVRLPALEAEIRLLGERKASCRNALISLPTLRAACVRAEETLNRHLSTLGPDWTIDRIRGMDRSLFVREELERRASAMQAADAALLSLTSSLERAAREREQSGYSVELARRTLESMVEPVAALHAEGRDSLRAQLTRVEEARHRLPEREKARGLARSEYGRALASLNMRRNAGPQEVEALAQAQEYCLALAEEVRLHTEKEAEAIRDVQLARKEEEGAAERLARAQAEEAATGGGDRASVNDKRQSLRRLRQTAALIRQEEERLSDLDDSVAAHEAAFPRPKPRILPLGAGALLGGLGLAVLGARLALGLTELDLTALTALPFWNPQWPVLLPLSLLGGYAVLFVGVALFAMGLPRGGPDRERAESQVDQLRSRRDASAAKLDELNAEAQKLSLTLQALSLAPSHLDELESRLEQEWEQCAAGERLRQESQTLHAELDAMRRRMQEKEAARAAVESGVQAARRKWHDHLERLHVASVPSPSSAMLYFSRVEATLRAHASMQALDEEIKELQGAGMELERMARTLLPTALWPQGDVVGQDGPLGPREPLGQERQIAPAAEESQTVALVRQTLESCRQAEMQAEERARAAEALRGAEEMESRARQRCQETEQALAGAQNVRADLEREWKEYLGGMGLDLRLSPATTREALDCMERCLAAELDLRRLREDCLVQEAERDALAKPLAAVLESLHREAHCGLDREIDWLATLDIVQRDVEAACRMAEEERRLRERMAEQGASLRESEAMEADARRAVDELLLLGKASDPEDFRRLAAIREEKAGLLRRCEDLEDALRIAADQSPLDEFLAEFAGLERDEMDARSAAVAQRLEALAEEERRLAADVASLDARLKDMGASRRLADLRLEEAALREKMDVLSYEWSRYALARHLLMDARRQYERDRQPDVVRMASALFCAMTGGVWTGISASLEDGALFALPPYGSPVPPEQLSRGAQEQLYLAMRMAHIRNRARSAAPLPVIMDDIMVNFDPVRAEHAMRAIAALTQADDETPGHQVLFFTCHPETAHSLRTLVPQSRLYAVEKGKIAVAAQ